MKKIGTMNFILIVCAVVIIAFIVVMIWVFKETGIEMSTLETCVFGLVTGEFGILGLIKCCKVRTLDRKEFIEDREYNEKHKEANHDRC